MKTRQIAPTFFSLISISFILLTGTSLVIVPISYAEISSWTGDSGNWSTDSNWDNGVPTSTTDALLKSFDATNRTVTYSTMNSAFNRLNLDATGSDDMTLNISGGTVSTIGSQDFIGYHGRGTVTQTGGTYTNNSMIMGIEPTALGYYGLYGGTLAPYWAYIGNHGTGVFDHSGGTVQMTTNLSLAGSSSGHGTYNLSSSGILNVPGRLNVGLSGDGVFNQSGGTNTVGNLVYIARFPGSTGIYTLNGGTLNADGGIVNNGTFIQSAGTNTTKQMFTQASNYTFSNGTLNTLGGFSNTGAFHQTGGINTSASGTTATIGSTGTYKLGGGTLNTNGGFSNNGNVNMTIGSTTGQLILGNGTNMTNNNTFNIIGQGNTGGGVIGNGGWSLLSNNIQNGSIIVQPVSYMAPAAPATPVTGSMTNSFTGTWTASNTYAIYGAVATNTTPTATPQVSLDYQLKTIFYNNGRYISDPSTSIFSDLINEPTGYLQGGVGDEFLILGNFENWSTQTGLWDTDESLLGFVGKSGTKHDYLLSGNASSFGWGSLYVAADNDLMIRGYSQDRLFFDKIVLETIGQLLDIESNIDIYYNALLDLEGKPLDPTGYDIGGTGRLIQNVPEPSTVLVLSLGLIGLAGIRCGSQQKALVRQPSQG